MKDNTDKIIKEIYRYCDSRSVLVIDGKGKVRRIFCPFKVRCIMDIDIYDKGDILIVTAVKLARNLLLVYIIDGKGYFYYSFVII
jgi:hypothetical protein